MSKQHDISTGTCPHNDRNEAAKNAATQPWDCHEHRDELGVSDANTVYHPEHGQLCHVEKRYDAVLHHPIHFASPAAAWHWIASGCIADLQEGLGCLGIGFTTACLSKRT